MQGKRQGCIVAEISGTKIDVLCHELESDVVIGWARPSPLFRLSLADMSLRDGATHWIPQTSAWI